ncbi:Protein of unknown function [Aromatoleum tolulyticum]|uniref:Uncharacterized protein n=1 Tax=Aromatoleum tolulyticum TaxID=34027 RepID=A0A1N6X0N0_9RHOO|nr:DUF2730 family protein [Aromatoleum tolulyticum]SIQ95924.1 Protein of unknown function [Aromatoleum tolulyticum]
MISDEIKFGLVLLGSLGSIINTVANAGLWLYVRYGDRNKEVDRKFSKLQEDFDDRADEQDKRLARLEGRLDRAPTHDDLGKLYEKINATTQAVSQMAGEMKGMNDTLRLILAQIAEKGMR